MKYGGLWVIFWLVRTICVSEEMIGDLLKWFEEEVLPEFVKSGKFSDNGKSQILERCDFEGIQHGVVGFASFPSFAKLVLKTSTETTSRDIFVKFQSLDPVFREKMKLVSQFQNEIAMYTQVLPCFVDFLKKQGRMLSIVDKVVPKFYGGIMNLDDFGKSIIMLEDLRPRGFKMAEPGTVLDLKHFLIAVERLAHFHAVSFAMKLQKEEAFEKLKKAFVAVWMDDEPQSKRDFQEFRGYTCQRGIDYLLRQKDSEVPEEYLKNFRELLEPTFEFLKSITSPREPIAVICHGDFNKNNLLFRYTNGDVTDAKLIDFQTSLYASPCLDLSFFIYMNTTLEFREKHFDEVFLHYYSTLIKTIVAILNIAEEKITEKLPIQAFKEDFGRVAANAYVIVSFFLPVMMAPSGGDFVQDIKTKSNREFAEENYKQGGDIVSRRIADVIVDFYRRKFYT